MMSHSCPQHLLPSHPPCLSLPMPSMHTRDLPSEMLTRMFSAKYPCCSELPGVDMALSGCNASVLEFVLAFVL